MNDIILDQLKEVSIEFLQCPFCGRKLERIEDGSETIKPTSCSSCKHHDFAPNNKRVVFVDDLKDLPDKIINYKGYTIIDDGNCYTFSINGHHLCLYSISMYSINSIKKYIDKDIFSGFVKTYDEIINLINNKKLKDKTKIKQLKEKLNKLIIKENKEE